MKYLINIKKSLLYRHFEGSRFEISLGFILFSLKMTIFLTLNFSSVIVCAGEIDHYMSRQTSSPQTNTLNRNTELIVGTPLPGTIGNGATTSEGWLDSTNFTAGNHYLLLAWSKLNTSATNASHTMVVSHGGTNFLASTTQEESDQTSTSLLTPYFWFHVWTAVTGEDIDLRFGGTGSGVTKRVAEASLIALDLNDLIFTDGDCDNDGAAGEDFYCVMESQFSNGNPVGEALTTTPTTKMTLNFTPGNDGEAWWILSYVMFDTVNTNQNQEGQLTIDGTVRGVFAVEGEQATIGFPIFTIGYVTTFNADATTVTVELSESGADEQWAAGAIMALRLNAFSQFLFDTTSGATGDISVFPTLTEIETTTFSNVSTVDWVTFAGGIVDDNNARAFCSISDQSDTDLVTATGGWQHNVADLVPNSISFPIGSVPPVSGVGTKYRCMELTDTANNLNDSWLLTFALDLATSTVSGTSNADAGDTVKLAIGGLELSKTVNPTVSGGTWSVRTGDIPAGASVTAWLDGQAANDRAVGITTFSSGSAITDMVLDEVTLTIGSNQNSTVSFAELDNYDIDNEADIFYEADSNVFTLDSAAALTGETLSILSGNTWSVAEDQATTAATVVNSGTVSIAGNTGTNFTITSLTNNEGSTVIYTGDSAAGPSNVDMEFNDGGTPNTVYNLTVVDTTGTNDHFRMVEAYDIGGTLTITSGDLETQGNAVTLAGNMANSDEITPTTSTVTLDGTTNQSISIGTNASTDFDNLIVTNALGTVTFVDNFAAVNFTAITPGTTMVFNAGDTYAISGTLDLKGIPTDKLGLSSDSGGSQFIFDVTGSDERVFFVDVTDSASSSNDIFAYSSTDSGNNDNTAASPHWEFKPLVGSILRVR